MWPYRRVLGFILILSGLGLSQLLLQPAKSAPDPEPAEAVLSQTAVRSTSPTPTPALTPTPTPTPKTFEEELAERRARAASVRDIEGRKPAPWLMSPSRYVEGEESRKPRVWLFQYNHADWVPPDSRTLGDCTDVVSMELQSDVYRAVAEENLPQDFFELFIEAHRIDPRREDNTVWVAVSENFDEARRQALYRRLLKASRLPPEQVVLAFPPEKPTKDFSWVEGVAVKLK